MPCVLFGAAHLQQEHFAIRTGRCCHARQVDLKGKSLPAGIPGIVFAPLAVGTEVDEIPRVIARRTSAEKQTRDKIGNQIPYQANLACSKYPLRGRSATENPTHAIENQGAVIVPTFESRGP